MSIIIIITIIIIIVIMIFVASYDVEYPKMKRKKNCSQVALRFQAVREGILENSQLLEGGVRVSHSDPRRLRIGLWDVRCLRL